MSDDSDDERTGLPGLPTWRAVYVLVAVVFAAYVAGLTALSQMGP